MPRGRPKGSKNSPKINFDIESNSSNIWGIKETSQNGIVWHHPLFPPFLTKEVAEKMVEERGKLSDLKEVSLVNMIERSKTFQKISVAPSCDSGILSLSETDGGSSGSEKETSVAAVQGGD